MPVAAIEDVAFGVMALAIPIVAIIGGITAGIVRIVGRQRAEELARRERIAAIERGVDPASLPALADDSTSDSFTAPESRSRQSLLVGGLVTLLGGFGLGFMLRFVEPHEDVWAVGAIPVCVGIALLLSYFLLKPAKGINGRSTPGAPPMD
jgi:hypothetical protein